jgi:DNA-binding CsgD family transcriptional regulator/CheY-like chemotaxis protein
MRKAVFLNHNKKLYTVKDKEANIALLENILEEEGYAINAFSNVQELLNEINHNQTDKKTKDLDAYNKFFLISANTPSFHKQFFEHFLLTGKWILDILNKLNIAFAFIYKYKYLIVNKVFCEIVELKPEELSDIDVGDMLHVKNRKTLRDYLKDNLKKKQKECFDYVTLTSNNNKIRKGYIYMLDHQIDDEVYTALYGFSDLHHNIETTENITYFKFISYELNTILSNLIYFNQLKPEDFSNTKGNLSKQKTYQRIKKYYSLTPREYDVFYFVAMGFTSHEIAQQLCISKRTVETHRTNILDKTGTKNSIELVRLAFRLNLFDK